MDQPEATMRVNAPTVVSELVDDEVIVINFESGEYHGLRGVAARAWQCIAATTSRERLVQAMLQEYQGEPEHIHHALNTFVDELAAANLITFDGATSPLPAAPSPSANGPVPFVAPVIETFTDMQGYLLMDPIHEVDSSGWPNVLTDPEQG